MQNSHQLTMTVLMTPDMANFAGYVHGGTILKLLDQVAYACASRYASRYVVTVVASTIAECIPRAQADTLAAHFDIRQTVFREIESNGQSPH